MTAKTNEKDTSFTLRLATKDKDRLVAAAVRERRSMSNMAEFFILEGLERLEQAKKVL